jgi:amino acid transporter
VPAVLAFILAGVAPLTVAAGLIPTAYGVTGLTGIPAAFIGVAVVLGVFATGYVAMSRNIVNAGAFYAFISQGLGRAAGVAAALIALLAYSCLQIALYGMLGPAAASQAAAHLGVHAAWWVWALGAWAVVAVLGLLRVDITGRVLGTLTAIDIAVILAETVTGLAHPAGGQLSFATLSPSALTSSGFGTVGVLAVIAVLGFSGFEQAPVLAEEARHPRRTIPVTTYTALGLIGVVYAGSAWAMAAHAGSAHVVAAADAQGPALMFNLGGSVLSQTAQWLFLTSLFAAALAFHNAVWRYAFALGREGRPAGPARQDRQQQHPQGRVAGAEFHWAGGNRGVCAGRVAADDRVVLRRRHHRRVRHLDPARRDVGGGDRVLRPEPAR